MALGDPYATVDQYFAIRREIDAPSSTSDEYAAVLRDLKAVTRYIDRQVGRPLGFGRDSDAIAAQGTLTLALQPVALSSFAVGAQTYSFVASGATAQGQINIGADLAEAKVNVVAAINGTDGISTANASASAATFVGNDCVITALATGTAGNAIVFTEALAGTGNVMDGSGLLGGTTAGAAVDTHQTIYESPSRGGGTPGWAEAENPWKAGHVTRVLAIDDHVSITAIDVDEFRDNHFSLAFTTNDYELLPRNAASLPEPMPYQRIQLTEWGSRWAWTPGARVRVTGLRGWPAVPGAIVSACIELTAILRVESPRATNRVTEVNQVVSTSRVAQGIVGDLLGLYKHAAVFA